MRVLGNLGKANKFIIIKTNHVPSCLAINVILWFSYHDYFAKCSAHKNKAKTKQKVTRP
jgi:hypothetical protein